jgi:adenosine deaminase
VVLDGNPGGVDQAAVHRAAAAGLSHPADRAFIVGLPKCEVHLHLEGCLRPSMVAEAARRQGVDPHPAIVGDRARVDDLPALLSYLDWSCRLIDRADLLSTLAYETAMRVTASGTRHIDVIVNPTHWPRWFHRLGPMVDALDSGFAEAEADGYATATLCISLKRSQSRDQALELVEWMLEVRHRRISGLSIDGDESSGSFTERFREAFQMARRGGLHRCAHAGESSGAQGVRDAVDVLGAERVDHGIRCVEDRALVGELAARRIPLDICPTSNVILGVAPDLASHPVEPLRRAGVPVSINTDDPAIYGIDLADEYYRCAGAFGWSRADVAAMARTSIESSFASDDRRAELLGDLASYCGS